MVVDMAVVTEVDMVVVWVVPEESVVAMAVDTEVDTVVDTVVEWEVV